jgi:1-aminocyclopropane-1-carboxylate deaminase/D-cysteine desulfhydrase-like pyridoxal-dependent ACC family enzyme
MNTLLDTFPKACLATLPTPIAELPSIRHATGHNALFVKQDNLSGQMYGGNKIRKLEYLLGEALEQECKSVITYGAAGSNHALATAVCCRQLGLKAISILAPQANTDHVRKNILMQHAMGAKMILCDHYTDFPATTKMIVECCRETDGRDPCIIPAGGSNATGALGFVNAGFELASQIQPDVIYIPMGTGGTHAGLLVGLKMAGLSTRVEAIRVVHKTFRTAADIKRLCDETCFKLGVDPFINTTDIIIRDEFLGADYGISTPEAEEAVELFLSKEGIYLETTYTGKTAAALLRDLRSGVLDGQTVLYWNTLNSHNFSSTISDIDFHDLPVAFHSYFSCL